MNARQESGLLGLGPPARARLEQLARCSLVFGLLLLVGLCFQLRHLPELGTDSLIYHLTLPAFWMQDGWLASVDLPFHDHAAEHAPRFSQWVSLGLMNVTGDAGLTWLIQPLALLGILGCFYASARRIGTGRALAAWLTATLSTFPPFLQSLQVGNNDLVLTLGVALALLGVLLSERAPGRGIAIGIAGVSMAIGTKTIGALFVLPILPCLAAAAPRAVRGLTPRQGVGWGVLLGALLLLGGHAFIIAWVATGNPIFPADLRLGEHLLGAGLFDSRLLITHGWDRSALGRLLWEDAHAFALRPPWSPLLWASALALPILLGARKKRWRVLAVGCLVPLCATALFFWRVPFWEQQRLLFPVIYGLWLGVAGAASALTRRLPPGRRGAGRALLGALLWCGLVGIPVVSALVGGQTWLLLAGIAALAIGWSRARSALVRQAACAVALFLVAALPALYPSYAQARERARQERYPAHYGAAGAAWARIDALAQREGSQRIAYSGTPIVYPLFGSRHQNHVRYLPVSATDRPRRIEVRAGVPIYGALARARRAAPDQAFWLRGLEEEEIGLLFLWNDPSEGGRGGVAFERKVVATHPARFELLFARDGVFLYRVNRTSRRPEPPSPRRLWIASLLALLAAGAWVAVARGRLQAGRAREGTTPSPSEALG